MSERASFNPAALERLIKLGGQKFALEMIALFGSYGGQKMAEARQAGDLPALAAAVHPLKSSAGNVGAARVQELAAQIEQAANEQQAEHASNLLTELEGAFTEAVKRLELEKTKLASAPS